MASNQGEFHTTTPSVMLWPALIEPRAYTDPKNPKRKGDPKYSAKFLLDPEGADFEALKDAVIAVAKEQWPKMDVGKAYREGKLTVPWASGDTIIEKRKQKADAKGEDYDAETQSYLAGKMQVSAATKKFRPSLAVMVNKKIVDLTSDQDVQAHKDVFYSGVEAYFKVNLVAYDPVGDDGKFSVTAYLQSVLSTGKGKRIGGQLASSTFSGYVGKNSMLDPTEGSDPDGLDDANSFGL